MILTHDLELLASLDARELACMSRGLLRAASGGARVVVVRVESLSLRPTGMGVVRGARADETRQGWARLVSALAACSLPTLAVIEGPVRAAWLPSIATCDVVLASAEGSFEAPRHIGRAELASGAPSLPSRRGALERRIPSGTLERWAREGSPHDARWAASAGLVDELFDDPAITATTAKWARALAGASPATRRRIRLRSDDDALAPIVAAFPFEAEKRASSSPPGPLRVVRPSPAPGRL
jgi:enoyl-CoA hydratase/carnithine racemase